MVCESARDGIMVLGAGANLAVSAELHYVIGNHAELLHHCYSLFVLLHYLKFVKDLTVLCRKFLLLQTSKGIVSIYSGFVVNA